MNIKHLFFSLMLCGAIIAPVSLPAAIIPGDAILVNITLSGDTAGGNWNDLIFSGGAKSSPWSLGSDLIRFSDGAATGVDFDATFGSGGSMGMSTNSFTQENSYVFPEAGSIPSIGSERLLYANEATFTFSGLDDSLTYNVSILNSHIGFASVDELSWTFNDGKTLTIDGDGADGNGIGQVVTTTGISTDGSGNLTFTSSSSGTQHFNAIELVAIPEPSSLMLMGLAMLGGVVVLRRHR
jgi:hypothetical protein